MSLSSLYSIIKIILHGRSAKNILMATFVSFSFSIAVILSTFGLMDGFDQVLKSGLRQSSGDIIVSSRGGYFDFNDEIKNKLEITKPLNYSPVIQTEAFILRGEASRGVLIRGIEYESFRLVTGLRINLKDNGVAIGQELAKSLNLKIGDSVALTFAKGNSSSESLPGIKVFEVTDIINHGIYQKDLRFAYLKRQDLAPIVGVTQKINQILINYFDPLKSLESLNLLEQPVKELEQAMDFDFYIKPFWSEYSFLLEAVKVEKFSISLILQIIVIVAVFNIVAFIIYTLEKKSQEFFLLRAVGLGEKKLVLVWSLLIFCLWISSCAGGYILTIIFDLALRGLSVFKVPGEIYVLSSLKLSLEWIDYIWVYSFSLGWITLAAFVGYLRLRKKSILQGLRQEFS